MQRNELQPDDTRFPGETEQEPASPSTARTVYARMEPHALAAAEQQVGAEWQVGDVLLDLYEVTGLLGEGGMGRVYKVHHRGWNVDLAVKSPRPEIFATAGGKENFVREAKTWVNLGLHPHTVSCYYVRTLGGIPRVFAEYLEGGSLSDWIRTKRLYEGGPEKARERVLDIAIQFAWGLHYAHEQGLVHQDVKPANVMMTADGVAKVTDFGLAKARGAAGEAKAAAATVAPGGAAAGAAAGRSILVSVGGMTPAYCSPEQARGEPLSRKTDLWSWAVSVLEMFTGEVTWLAGQAAPDALAAYLEADGGNSAQVMPPVVVALLKRCFRYETDGRPNTMAGVASELQAAFERQAERAYSRPEPKPAELTADILNNRALSYLDLAKEQEADNAWRNALASDAHHIETTFNRGILRWRRGEQTDKHLVRELQEVRSSHEAEWLDEYLLALVHIERGDAETARELLEEAAPTASRVPEIEAALQLARSLQPAASRCLRVLEGHQGPVSAVCGDSEARLIVSGSEDKTVRVWEAETGRCLHELHGHEDEVLCVYLSSDSRHAVSGGKDHQLRVWDVHSGRCLRILKGHAGPVNSVWLANGARWLLSAADDHSVRLWDVTRCARIFEGHLGRVTSLAMSGDGCWAVSGGDDRCVRVWEVATGECARQIPPSGTPALLRGVSCLAIDSSARVVLLGNSYGELQLWDVAQPACARTLRGHTESIRSVSMSADGRWAVSASGDGVTQGDVNLRLWDVAAGRCVRTFAYPHIPRSVWMSADGGRAFSGGGDRAVTVWELRGNGPPAALRLSLLRSQQQVSEVERRANELHRTAQEAIESNQLDRAIQALHQARSLPGHERQSKLLALWAQISPRCRKKDLRGGWLARRLEGHSDDVYSVDLTADGHRAVTASTDQTLRVWEVASGNCERVLEGHQSAVVSARLSACGRRVVSGSWDNTARLWDAESGRCLRVFEGHSQSVESVCLSADARWVLTGSRDATARLWEAATGRSVRILKAGTQPVLSVCIASDDRWALSLSLDAPGGGDSSVHIWDLATGAFLRSFDWPKAFMVSASLSADGRRVLLASLDNTVRLVDTFTGHCLAQFAGHQRNKGINCVSLSADGCWALSVSMDQTMRLWELPSGREVRIFEGHNYELASVCLSADTLHAISTARGGEVCVWDLDWELEAPPSGETKDPG